MQDKISGIREKLSTTDFFKKWSQNIIELYKAEQYSKLNEISSRIFTDKKNESDNTKKIFYSLIKVFHPDSYKFHLKKFNNAVADKDFSVVDFYTRMTSVKIERTVSSEKEDFDYKEYYTYQEEEYDSWLFEEGENGEADVISVLSQMFLGNSGKYLEPVDLEQIEGELILSDISLRNLEGIQFCTGVTNLDLSHNSIENIYELGSLKHLEELDLSSNEISDIDMLENLVSLEILYLDFNRIEDLSVLLKLEELKFVSVSNNPVKNTDVVSKLKDKGIIVIDY